MIRHKQYLLTPVLAITILLNLGMADCRNKIAEFNVGAQIEKALETREALLDKLEAAGLPHDLRLKYGTDVGNWASDGLALGKSLKACADNPCRLAAVENFQTGFWATFQSGRWGDDAPAKLKTVRTIMEGLILGAKIFFGFRAPAVQGGTVKTVTEADLKAKINELRTAMQP